MLFLRISVIPRLWIELVSVWFEISVSESIKLVISRAVEIGFVNKELGSFNGFGLKWKKGLRKFSKGGQLDLVTERLGKVRVFQGLKSENGWLLEKKSLGLSRLLSHRYTLGKFRGQRNLLQMLLFHQNQFGFVLL